MKVTRILSSLVVVALAITACASTTGGGGTSTKKIALLLPETKTARYESKDRPLFEGKVTIAKEYDTPGWGPDKAQDEMTQALTALGNKVDGVYAANDGTGGGAIAAMKTAGVKPLPPVTGQDAELAAIQRILIGEQYMTVYEAIVPEAEGAAQLAVDLVNGTAVPSSMTAGAVTNNTSKDVPSVLLKA